ncbi:MAG: hypothetical protein M0Q53_01975 [Prolixibacteraceae bacterium]|jgi:hypothetical protein|nr:hypothetical protein [Prolixibacteraceae bacterium]
MSALLIIRFGLLMAILLIRFTSDANQIDIEPIRLQNLLNKAIVYLDRVQVKIDSIPFKYKGEWPSEIVNLKDLPILGSKGYSCYDSNCFVTSSIHNILAEIYLNDPSYRQIPTILELSVENILSFKSGNSFNFWHELRVPENIRNRFTEKNKITRRRSNHFNYTSGYTSCLFNIFNDADDSAEAFRSVSLYNKICKLNGLSDRMVWKPDSIGWVFNKYRDIDRSHINYYNFYNAHGKNTGAFLTWFGNERYSTFLFPERKDHNLPLGINDIDCVVNANVLTSLAEYGEENSKEAKQALNWIFKMVEKEKCNSCGYYYPSCFSLFYALSKAISKGVAVREDVIQKAINQMVNSQKIDGSWGDEIEGNELHCSLYALNALIDLCNKSDSQLRMIIEKGLNFVEGSANIDSGFCYWEGGAFFSVGGIARKSHIWRSRAYTTALAAEALGSFKSNFFQESTPVEQ